MIQFCRYLLVQLLAYVVEISAFLWLLEFYEGDPVFANVTSKLAAGAMAFFLHRGYTFHGADAESRIRQFTQYFFVLALNIPLSTVLLSALLLGLSETVIAKTLSDASCLFITYVVSKNLVFLGGDHIRNKPKLSRSKK